MLEIAVVATAFGLVFVSELPDKTAIAGLVLGTRFPWRWVFVGIAAAFLVHVIVAVAAGSLLTLLPRDVVEAVVAGLFLLGAVLVWREGRDDLEEQERRDEAEASALPDARFWKVASLGFGVIFVAEWGDLTQIMTANLAAKYDSPISVAVGALLALWSVALLAILGGRTLLRLLPIRWITRIAAAIMLALSAISLVNAVSG
ncbi:MAG TPA: TMEM165/GDT1 family protein [Jatrophihabitans sp.]|nr:TMEM165/GDT1 family protein [Jatrophihabitans sp.]